MSVGIRFEKNERRNIVYFSHGGQTLANAQAFSNWLVAYSLAAITKVAATQATLVAGSAGSGDYGSVHLYAKVLMRSAGDKKIYAVIIPAPVSSIFTADQEVTEEFGIECAARYSILAGATFTFVSGALMGDSV
jgi:hypothetical protein